jgi:sporulation protein YlmC with PRC-barrel domain
MLQSIKKLHGNKLGASDGDIGHVKDFYFDDHTWVVRYVVVDTGSWLPGRQVLLSPYAFGSISTEGKIMRVNLTRKQIEESPSIDLHKPVSRQHEEAYHRYYGWPYYWEGDGLWGGMRGFPILDLPPRLSPVTPPVSAGPLSESADAHLCSTQAVNGYHLQACDGTIVGHVCDFMMDPQTWAINQLLVKTGHRLTGKEVPMPMDQVERIGYEESTVFVKLTKDAVVNGPEQRPMANA